MSLLAEMFATWMGFRARILRQGITNLLTDLQEEEYADSFKGFSSKFRHALLLEPRGFKSSKAGEFYREPSIRYLAQGTKKNPLNHIFLFRKGKASYISKENFSATLINMFRKKGRGIHDWARVKFSITHNTLHLDLHSHEQIYALLEDSDNDMGTFIEKLELRYEEMMDRVNGWYKRKMRLIVFLLGFIIASILNVDTFEIVKTLSKDKKSREQFLQLAAAAVNDGSRVSNMIDSLENAYIDDQLYKTFYEINQDIENSRVLLGNGWEFPHQDIGATLNHKDKYELPFDSIIRRVKRCVVGAKEAQIELKLINQELSRRDRSHIQLDHLYRQKKVQVNTHQHDLAHINAITGKSFVQINKMVSWKNGSFTLYGKEQVGFFDKVCHIVKYGICPIRIKFWGFMITALALSLGAPFWFDLLKKLVALRGAGVNPEEKEKKVKKISIKKRKDLGLRIKDADAIDIALYKNRAEWLAIPGVIAVNKVLKVVGQDCRKHVIKISHLPGMDVGEIPKSVPREGQKGKGEINIETEARNYAVFQNNNPRVKIFHTQKGELITGAIAGKLKNLDSGKTCILSCGHVLSNSGGSIVFSGKNKHLRGTIKKAIWTNMMDAGVIDIDDTAKSKYRTIPEVYYPGTDDFKQKTVVRIYKQNGEKIEAKIMDVNIDYLFRHKYTEKMYELYNLITLYDSGKILTHAGDSGALVTCLAGADNKEKSLGIIVGGLLETGVQHENPGSKLSFVLPMTRILSGLNLQIIKN